MSVMHLSRSFGIAAHVDAGKTTLSERILFHTGRLHRIAEVHDGGATTDPMPSEKKHGISIQAAATHCVWREHALERMFGYAAALRSATSGTGSFSMTFARYGQRRLSC